MQGLIDKSGRYRPIDFQGIRRLSNDPKTRAEQIEDHWTNVDHEIDLLEHFRANPRIRP